MSNDYIAIARVAGGSSWARAASQEVAIQNLKRLIRADWKRFVRRGDEIAVTLVNATGIDNVYWDCDGIWNGDSNERIGVERIARAQITI